MENIILVFSFVFGVINYWLIAKWYVMPVLEKYPRNTALIPLILIHCFRYLGLSFLLPGVVATDISPVFALPAAYGDLLAAILALLAVISLRSNSGIAIPLVWIFNIIGTVDLLNAITQGLLNIHAGQFGGAYYIPIIIVPALIVSHLIIFQLLVKPAEVQK
jgi:hypothetical protein